MITSPMSKPMPSISARSVAVILVGLVCLVGVMPHTTQAKSYLGHKLLTHSLRTKDTLKWKVKNLYLKKATFKKALVVKGNTTLGNATTDSVELNGTVTSTLGAVEVDDDLHITGTVTLDTPLEASALSDSAVVKSLTAGDNMTITDNGLGDYSLASAAGALGTSISSSELDADAVTAAVLAATAIQSGDIETADLPSDGYASTYVNTSGDAITGSLNINSGSLIDNGVVRQLAAQLNIPDAGATVALDAAIGSLAGSQPMAVTVGVDGMPIAVFWDSADQDITVVHCTNRSCSATDTAVDIDSTVSSDRSDVAIAIGSDGLPFIAYFDITDNDSTVVHCSSTTCSSSTATDIDTSGGSFSGGYSIIIGTDGFPLISYFDGDGGNNLMVNHCTNAACTTSGTAVEVDSDVGSSIVSTSMIMNIAGIPMIAYGDATDGDVTIATCTTATCSAVTLSDVDADVTSPATLSLTVNALGNPLLAYYDATDSDLTVFSCGTYDCTNGTVAADIDTSATAGSVAMVINPVSNLPVILYGDASDSILHLVTCQSNTCNDTFPSISTIYSAGIFGGDMTFGSDGNPLLLYSDPATDTIMLQQCSNAYCQNYWTRR